MDVGADALDPLREPAEVGESGGSDPELVEAEEPVEEDDWIARSDAARGAAYAPQPAATAKPDDGGEGCESEGCGGSDRDEDFEAHQGTIRLSARLIGAGEGNPKRHR